jgi:glutamine cyclotransferase
VSCPYPARILPGAAVNRFAAFAVACALLGCAREDAIPRYGVVVRHAYPHDTQAFTEGLSFRDGYLFESTGWRGHSSLRKVELATGKVVRKMNLSFEFYGEGSAPVGRELVALTWLSNLGFVYDRDTFALKRQFRYPGEGWGLASDERYLYMSDGSASIRVLDAATLRELRRIEVTAKGIPVERLNELEMVEGELFANVWKTDLIARIDPRTGKVLGWIDLEGLLPPAQRGTDDREAVLNGIAWDSHGRRLFVTGKLWPKLFHIELVRTSTLTLSGSPQ